MNVYEVKKSLLFLVFFCLRSLADKVAASGFYVVVPDYFHGDPFDPSQQERPIPVWIKDHGAVRFLILICLLVSLVLIDSI